MLLVYLSLLFLVLLFDFTIELFEVGVLSTTESDIEMRYGTKNSYAMKLQKNKKELLIALLIYETCIGYLMSFFLLQISKFTGIYVATFISIFSVIVHIGSGIIAKLFGLNYKVIVSYYLSIFFYWLVLILKPINFIFAYFNDKILGLFPLQEEKYSNYKISILKAIMSQNSTERDVQIIKSALSIYEINIDQIMTSRVDFMSIEFSEDINEIKNELINSGHKHIIILKDEEIVGTINKYIFFKKILLNEVSNVLYEIMPPKLFSAQTKVAKLLEYFSTTKQNIVFVEDEGDIIGLVTLTDIIGEIVGQIEGEDYYIETTEKGVLIEGSYMIRQLNKKMNWDLPELYLTLSGLILSISYKVPNIGSVYEYRSNNLIYYFEILDTAQNLVKKVRVNITKIENSNDILSL